MLNPTIIQLHDEIYLPYVGPPPRRSSPRASLSATPTSLGGGQPEAAGWAVTASSGARRTKEGWVSEPAIEVIALCSICPRSILGADPELQEPRPRSGLQPGAGRRSWSSPATSRRRWSPTSPNEIRRWPTSSAATPVEWRKKYGLWPACRRPRWSVERRAPSPAGESGRGCEALRRGHPLPGDRRPEAGTTGWGPISRPIRRCLCRRSGGTHYYFDALSNTDRMGKRNALHLQQLKRLVSSTTLRERGCARRHMVADLHSSRPPRDGRRRPRSASSSSPSGWKTITLQRECAGIQPAQRPENFRDIRRIHPKVKVVFLMRNPMRPRLVGDAASSAQGLQDRAAGR